MKQTTQHIRATAKLNLSLWVGAPMDNGYHPIQSVFQEIEFSDQLLISIETGAGISMSCDHSDVPTTSTNTILKAHQELLAFPKYQAFLSENKVLVTLRKQIPLGSGLGGGSSNAAAYLKAMNTWCELGLSLDELEEIGAKIGADIPFFIRGGTALVEGVGEILTPISRGNDLFFVLIFSGDSLSTQEVYDAYDQSGVFSEISETQGNAEFLLKNGSYLGRNDLKSVVMANSKTLSCCEKDVSRVTGLPVSMSGSGATLFLAFSSQSEAEKVLKGCQKDLPQYQFILTRAV